MGKGIVVEVTEEMIRDAEREDSSHCMIAEAIKAALPYARYVSVDLQTIRWTDSKNGKRIIHFSPPRVQQRLLSFDDGVQLDPFAFALKTPAQVQPVHPARLGAKRRAAGDVDGSGKARRRPKRIDSRGTVQIEGSGGRALPHAQLVGGYIPSTVVKGRRRVFGLRAMARSEATRGMSMAEAEAYRSSIDIDSPPDE